MCAVIKQGILGGFSGKIGNIVGSSWKGIAVMKTKPLSVANPKTAKQIEQRTYFSDAVSFASQILADVIKPLWDRFSVRMSGYNNFVQYNIANIKPRPDLAGAVKISNGAMATTPIANVVIANDLDVFEVTWVDDSGEGLKLSTDEAYVVICDDDMLVAKGYPAVNDRAETSSDQLPFTFASGETYHVYLAFRRADGTVVNQSSYFEATAPIV